MLSQYFSSPEKRIQCIVKLATEQNFPGLNGFLKKNGNCIDEYHDDTNAVMLLARENKYQPLMFLINHYNANKKAAVRGAIQGKHFKLMEELFLFNAYIINAAVFEAAYSNNEELTFRLINKGADKNKALFGAAAGNNKGLLDKLIQDNVNLEFLVRGLVLSGNENWVGQLIKKHTELKHAALLEAAITKNPQLTYKLINEGAHEKYAAWGAAYNHWISFLHTLELTGEILSWAIMGAAAGGHSQLVEYLLTLPDSNIADALCGAAQYGHFNFTWQLIKKGRETSAQAGLRGAMIGEQVEILNSLSYHFNVNNVEKYIYNNYSDDYQPTYESILHFLALVDNSDLRKKVAYSACIRNKNLIFSQLLHTAGDINRLIRNGYNFLEAKALKTMGTVIWGFYAPHIVKKKHINDEAVENKFPPLPVEIYLYICSYVFGLNNEGTYKLHEKLNRRLHTQVLTNYSPGVINNIYRFFSSETEAKLIEYKNDFEKTAIERLKKRLLIYAGDIEKTLPLQMGRNN